MVGLVVSVNVTKNIDHCRRSGAASQKDYKFDEITVNRINLTFGWGHIGILSDPQD